MEVLGGDITKEPMWKYKVGHYEGTYVEVLGGDITKEPMWKY